MVMQPDITWIGAHADNYYGTRHGHRPVSIVCHIAEGSLASVDSWFQNPAAQASTHYCIGPGGEIHQYVDLNCAPFANGRVESGATWWGLQEFPGVNPNYLTISIETAGKHPDPARGRYYTPTEAQVTAYTHLIAWLCQQYGIRCDREHIIGHYEISPESRPNCPGPNFPFVQIIEGARRLLREDAGMFADMEGHWARDAVVRLAQIQLPDGKPFITGRPQADGTVLFEPDKPMTRAETAVLFERLLRLINR
ncbi:MAG TPA: peptidoglycan recognition family protein [Symbiobacteriaceae bacterium]|nr:peptidoglycan recognition family protein [Symbiobacteriaceae bacterium]